MDTNFLVIGSGVAGLSFALKACKYGKVIIATKNKAGETNTRYAQGGIACVIEDSDSFEKHIQDTLIAGDGACNPETVRMVVQEAPAAIQRLIDWGVAFSRQQDKMEIGLEGGHSHRRILHKNDITGFEIETTLLKAVKNEPNIQLLEWHTCIELLTAEGECYGGQMLDIAAGRILNISSRFTCLCTGGAGQIFQQTSNPSIATGDGIALANRVGAQLKDMEFVQFHPTLMYAPGHPSFLISEALRGAGAHLVNANGDTFMQKYHPMLSLAPRDIVSRAMFAEMKVEESPCMYIDATGVDKNELCRHFPTIFKTCMERGIDIRKQLIPVVPAAHYLCGGVETDLHGFTSISRLYAFGEVASTGLHGANRLASNSLLEAVVFSERALEDMKLKFHVKSTSPKKPPIPKFSEYHPLGVDALKDQIKKTMWNYCGIVRTQNGLECGSQLLALLRDEANHIYANSQISIHTIELRNMVQVASLIIQAAKERKENCGAHFMLENEDVLKKTDYMVDSRAPAEL